MKNAKQRANSFLVSLAGVAVLALAVYAADTFGLMDNYIRGIFIQCCYAIIMVTSLNLVMGYLGQIALGHTGFMAIGAYTSALVTKAINLGIKAGTITTLPPAEGIKAYAEMKKLVADQIYFFVPVEKVLQPLIFSKRLGNISDSPDAIAIGVNFSAEQFYFKS